MNPWRAALDSTVGEQERVQVEVRNMKGYVECLLKKLTDKVLEDWGRLKGTAHLCQTWVFNRESALRLYDHFRQARVHTGVMLQESRTASDVTVAQLLTEARESLGKIELSGCCQPAQLRGIIEVKGEYLPDMLRTTTLMYDFLVGQLAACKKLDMDKPELIRLLVNRVRAVAQLEKQGL